MIKEKSQWQLQQAKTPTKTCSVCNIEKIINAFYPRKPYCIDCTATVLKARKPAQLALAKEIKTNQPTKRLKLVPKCHPDRQHIGKGKCEECYHKQRYLKRCEQKRLASSQK